MKKRLLCFITLLTATISAVTLTNNVKAATKWNTSKSVTKEENGIKYSAYLTEDGKESWIYRIKLSRKLTKLKLPEEINQAKLTRVGYGKNYTEKDTILMKMFLEIRLSHGMDVMEHYQTMIKIKEQFNKLYFQIQ